MRVSITEETLQTGESVTKLTIPIAGNDCVTFSYVQDKGAVVRASLQKHERPKVLVEELKDLWTWEK